MTDAVGLTALQFRCLTFIDNRVTENGIPPSYEEIKEHLDLSSKSRVHALIVALERRGYIRRLPDRARAIQVVSLPRSSGLSKALIAGLPLPDLFKLKTNIEEQIRLKLEAA